jgi:hypothetical protein
MILSSDVSFIGAVDKDYNFMIDVHII